MLATLVDGRTTGFAVALDVSEGAVGGSVVNVDDLRDGQALRLERAEAVLQITKAVPADEDCRYGWCV